MAIAGAIATAKRRTRSATFTWRQVWVSLLPTTSLTHRRTLGGSVPQAERVFLAGRIDAQRHHETVLGKDDTIDEDRDQIHSLE